MSLEYLRLLQCNQAKIQPLLNKLLEKYQVEPVGTGYIDCITPLSSVSDFIEELTTHTIVVYGVTWWYYCDTVDTLQESKCSYGMGGPQSKYRNGWFSETMLPFHEIRTTELDKLSSTNLSEYSQHLNTEIKNYILYKLRQTANDEPCLVPALWLYVPEDWQR
ncbi:hypothetical protein ACFSGI_09835 [Paenibacillus nicotianae]|uniref:Uncharacterized protein n=1 Tax=Paenibacillus nicotianae TaxID=1526551 RepID=A0ABW4US63_9BACL